MVIKTINTRAPGLCAASDLRADHNHQTVAKGANPHHEVGQRQPELEQADGPLVVVISIKQDRVFAVSL